MKVSVSVPRHKYRKKILKLAKGFFGRKKNCYNLAQSAVSNKLIYEYRDRKRRKRLMKSLWIQRINAGARQLNMSYSKFRHVLKEKNINLNTKMLADLAANNLLSTLI